MNRSRCGRTPTIRCKSTGIAKLQNLFCKGELDGIAYLPEKQDPSGRGETGRRKRLKISRPRSCGFDPRRPHQNKLLIKNIKTTFPTSIHDNEEAVRMGTGRRFVTRTVPKTAKREQQTPLPLQTSLSVNRDQAESLAAIFATWAPWYFAASSSTSEGWREPSPSVIVDAP